jgi:hypothetical protein
MSCRCCGGHATKKLHDIVQMKMVVANAAVDNGTELDYLVAVSKLH